ncbi:MAG: DUF58 domain-containing protein [Dictyoglomus sp.]|uniref:DUF58 domain-containing protein n=1 Tax=Dictyoglomus sp. TaxID=28205 RepID=UPI003D0E95A5
MTYFSLTSIGYLLIFFDIVLYLIGFNVSSTPVLLVSTFIMGLYIINFFEIILQPLNLRVKVQMPLLVKENEYEFINIYFENNSKIPKGQVFINLQGKTPLGGLRGKEKKEISIYFHFKKRGIFYLKTLNLRFTGTLGLLYLSKNYKVDGVTYIYPSFYPLSQDIYLTDGEGNKTSSSFLSVIGEEFHSLRDYQPQDPLKIVAWKASAKKGKLLSKNFEKLKKGSLMILIDNSVDKKDSIAEEEFDQLLRFVHSLLIPSFSLNIPLSIRDLRGEEEFNPKTSDELKKYLAEIQLIERRNISFKNYDYDIIFTLNYRFWDEKVKINKIIGVEYHKKEIVLNKGFIFSLGDDPQEFLSRFLVLNQS